MSGPPALQPLAEQELVDIVGRAHVLTGADERSSYETDWTGRFAGQAPAVVRPGSGAEVTALLDVARRRGLVIVPQGGNTGLVGGGVPLRGELVLSLRRLQEVGPVDPVSRQVTAEAGATVAAVQHAAAAAGLRYAVDFAARDSATFGGSIATNAGGLHVLRYGGTREQLVGIEAVLGGGLVVSQLHGLVKDNSGYHLPSLLCGSEGTLGVVTRARVRLVSRHEHRTVALVAFEGVAEAVAAVAAWRSALDSLEAAELVLAGGVELVCQAFDLRPPFARPWPAYVVAEVADHRDPTDDLSAVVAASAGVGDVAVATDAAHRASLWRYREDHTLAINTLGPPHKFDVSVPLGAVADIADSVARAIASARPAARTWIFGHVGDGNLHVNVSGLPPDDQGIDEVVLRHIAEAGGSISAEHGIGTAKRRWLHLTRSADELAAQRAVKAALDPYGILNPHVLLPPP